MSSIKDRDASGLDEALVRLQDMAIKFTHPEAPEQLPREVALQTIKDAFTVGRHVLECFSRIAERS